MPSLGSLSIGVFEDNPRAIKLAKNPLSASNGDGIDVRDQSLREVVGPGDLWVKHLRTQDQHADILTKATGTVERPRAMSFCPRTLNATDDIYREVLGMNGLCKGFLLLPFEVANSRVKFKGRSPLPAAVTVLQNTKFIYSSTVEKRQPYALHYCSLL